jgi:hypothetical protein
MVTSFIRSTPIIFLTVSICWVSSCNFDFDLGSTTIPPPTAVPFDQIAGNYEGEITYWENTQSSVSHLSLISGYSTTVIWNDTLFTISFDTTFLYTVPNLNFELEFQRFHPRAIVLIPGQEYAQWNNLAGEFFTDSDNNFVNYHLAIRPVSADSTYFLSFSGTRIGP